MLGYQDGWLTFESTDGEVRKRLPVYPPDWEALPDTGLETLLQQAELVRVEGRGAERSGEREEAGTAPRLSDFPPARPASDVIRTFAYPGGRVWSAWEQQLAATGEPSSPQPRTTLRFTSGTRTLYLHRWPEDWASYTDSQLADLLWRSMPREPQGQRATEHRRRRGDIGVERGDIDAEPSR